MKRWQGLLALLLVCLLLPTLAEANPVRTFVVGKNTASSVNTLTSGTLVANAPTGAAIICTGDIQGSGSAASFSDSKNGTTGWVTITDSSLAGIRAVLAYNLSPGIALTAGVDTITMSWTTSLPALFSCSSVTNISGIDTGVHNSGNFGANVNFTCPSVTPTTNLDYNLCWGVSEPTGTTCTAFTNGSALIDKQDNGAAASCSSDNIEIGQSGISVSWGWTQSSGNRFGYQYAFISGAAPPPPSCTPSLLGVRDC